MKAKLITYMHVPLRMEIGFYYSKSAFTKSFLCMTKSKFVQYMYMYVGTYQEENILATTWLYPGIKKYSSTS